MGRLRVGLVSGFWAFTILVAVLGVVLNVPLVGGSGTIYLRADGSIDPPTAPISTVDNVTYTFTGNVYDQIVVERNNIIIDGNGSLIQGAGSGNGLYLLGVNNVTIKKTNVEGFEYGVYLNSSSHITLYMSNITNNSASGVELNNSSQNAFIANNILNNQYGIWIGFSSDKNTVIGNNITNNSYLGVSFWSSHNTFLKNNIKDNSAYGVFFGYYPNNTVSGNNIANSWVGLYVNSPNNTISGNNIANNGFSGIAAYSSNNKIFHNNFINNPYQVSANGGNTWDNGYPSGGNYWSDYAGVDLYGGPYQNQSGSDGIGDTPNPVYPYSTDKDRDRYPLMSPWPSGPGLHETQVTLKSPLILALNASTTLEATVSNNGINNETDVDLFLFINNTLVNSTSIPSLEAGVSYALSYLWTPTIESVYNVTAYAMPVPEEIYAGNNRETSFVVVRYPILLRIPYNYSTIQEAIDAVSLTMLGDTIQVAAGTYYENVVVNKNYLTLVGENPSTTIIDGNGTGTVVTINASNVAISNFTIQNSGSWSWPQVGAGISLESANNCNITKNNIINNGEYAVYLSSSSYNAVFKNNITNNSKWGVYFSSSSYNTLLENNITNNGYYGVYLYGSSANNNILKNSVAKNWYGINIGWMSNNNAISSNNVTNNREDGVRIDGSSYNMLKNNTMMGNRYNFIVSGWYLSEFVQDVDTSNTVDGKSVYYLINQTNLTIDPSVFSDMGYLALINSNNITVQGLELKNKGQGLLLAYTKNSLIRGNNLTNNWIGVHLFSSANNSLTGNIINNNDYGVFFSGTSSNIVSGNNIRNNSVGIFLLYYSNKNSIHENNVTDNGVGIHLWDCYNNTITGNNIVSKRAINVWGVVLTSSFYNIVSGNNIRNNSMGLWLYGYDWGSSYNNLSRNTITDNDYGIWLDYRSSYNNLSGNIITENDYGIYLSHGSSYNGIHENNITHNYNGIYFYSSSYWETPSNNKIYHNNFIDNILQVSHYSSHLTITNLWDDDYPSGGNYWSDYNGTDSDGDGIGDTPYIIDENNRDRYPLMGPYERIPKDLTPPTTCHDYGGFWHTIDFSITLNATDDMSGVAETYYKINDGPTRTVSADGQPLITIEGANNKLEYWSIDNAGNEEFPHKILTEIKLDKTTPSIDIPSREPDGEVLLDQPVTISVNVTDIISQVKNVTLHYSLDNGTTWETPIPMDPNPSTELHEATIPGQEAGTWVRFKIVAYDYAGNSVTLDGTEPYCTYYVIPEFPSSLIPSLFMVLSLITAVFAKKKCKNKRTTSKTPHF